MIGSQPSSHSKPDGVSNEGELPVVGVLARRVRLLVEGREHASIEEITKARRGGVRVFFQPLPEGKEEFFGRPCSGARLCRRAGGREQGVIDPAEVFARSFRLTGRIALSEPALLAPLLSRGTEVLLIRRGLRESALADLDAGVRSGGGSRRSTPRSTSWQSGVLLGLVRLVTADPGGVSEQTIDDVTAGALRLLGVSPEAAAIVSLPLPDLPPCAYRTRGAAVRGEPTLPSRGRVSRNE